MSCSTKCKMKAGQQISQTAGWRTHLGGVVSMYGCTVGTERRVDRWMDRQIERWNSSPCFYRTSSPIGSVAQLGTVTYIGWMVFLCFLYVDIPLYFCQGIPVKRDKVSQEPVMLSCCQLHKSFNVANGEDASSDGERVGFF